MHPFIAAAVVLSVRAFAPQVKEVMCSNPLASVKKNNDPHRIMTGVIFRRREMTPMLKKN